MKRFYLMLLALFAFSSSVLVGTASAASTDPIIINGHKFVDLGLPSGLLWAETNVGASSATDDGDYFAWGETEPKTNYSWDTYKWGNTPSKYNFSDDKITLDSEDDAATVNWGSPCRMPSVDEFQELYSKCDWSKQGNGYKVTGPNGRSIFFPASGYRYKESLYNYRSIGFYWSRSRDSDATGGARRLEFSGGIDPAAYYYRYEGYSVRPVAENKNKSDASDDTDNTPNQTLTYNSYLRTDISCGIGTINNRMAYMVSFYLYNDGTQNIKVTKCVVRTPDGNIFTTADQSILGVVKAGEKGGFTNYSYYTSQYLRFDYHTEWYYTLNGVEYVFDSEKEYPTNISNVEEKTDIRELQRYDINGRAISSPQKGINIIRYSDGTTKKVIIK